ncbi:MAG: hypothetical protein HDT26_04630 [Subdoligranulum sp.]|nr:hypothetical protein [Subdoligranulum sp.]
MLSAVQGAAYGRNAYLSVYASRRVSAQTGAVRPAQPDTPVQAVEPVRSAPRTPGVSEHPDYLQRWSSDPVSMAVRSRIEYMDDAALARLRNEAGASFAQSAPVKAYSASAALWPQGAQETGAAAADAAGAFAPQGMQGAGAAAGVLFPQGAQSVGAAGALSPQGVQGADAAGTLSPQGVQGAQGVEETKSAREVMEDGECQTCKERKYQDGSDDPGVSFKTAQHIAPEMAASEVRGHEMEHVVREQASAAREGRKVVSQSVTYHTDICPECGKAYVSGGTTRTTTAAQTDAFAVVRGNGKEKGGFSGFSAMI